MKKSFKHPGFIIFLIAVLLLGGFLGAKYVVWPFYKDWRDDRLVAQAQTLYEAGDYDTAYLAIRKVITSREQASDWELALKIIQNLPQQKRFVPGYLQKLTEIDPNNPAHFNNFCLLALRLKEPEAARVIYEKYPDSGRDQPIYHELGFGIYSTLGETEIAEDHLATLLAHDPNNPKYLYSLAVLNLKSEDKEKVKAAEEKLYSLAEVEDYRARSIRVLLTHFIVTEKKKEALRVVKVLENMSSPSLLDLLLIAQTYTNFSPDSFQEKWKAVQNWEVSSASDVAVILDFLIRNSKFDLAIEWIESIPEALEGSMLVSQKVGQVYYLSKNWKNLQNYLETFADENDDGWRDKEFGRFLLLALANRLQGKDLEFLTYWDKAIVEVGNNKEYLRRMFEQAIRWGWPEEAISVLERTFQLNAADTDISGILMSYYIKTGKTERLIEHLAKRLEVVPNDKGSKNNYALISLLLNRNTTSAYSYARDNYRADRENPFFITTWAFALASQGRTQEAVQILEKLSDEEKTEPNRIIYLASIYLDAQMPLVARELLSFENIETQIPEEKEFLSKLRKRLEREFQTDSIGESPSP